MAEEKDDKKEGRKEKKEAPVAVNIFAGEMTADRRIAVNVFVSKGGIALAGERVDVFFGDSMIPTSGYLTITDAMGKAGTIINIPAGVKGPQKIYAHAKVTHPSSIVVEIPEEQKSQIPVVDKLDIEPTGQWYDDEGASHGQWTPRAFDASGKAVEAKLHIVGARPFKIIGLTPPIEVEKKIFDIPVSREIKTYEVVVASPGLLEVDVFVEGIDAEDEFMLEGARQAKQPGFFTRRYLERRERRR